MSNLPPVNTPPSRPEIILGRQLRDMSADALQALYASNKPPKLFCRSGEPVRVRLDDQSRPRIESVDEVILRHHLSDAADFRKRTLGGLTDALPPASIANDILATESLTFPALECVVQNPVLRRDGSILDQPGYDAPSGLYYHPSIALDGLRVPENPSREDVADGVTLIQEAVGEFPYADGSALAHTFATLLTPLVRPTLLGTSPLNLIDAPQQGTGKGLLTNVIAIITTGQTGAMMVAPDNEEEWRKRITATLYSGSTVIVIDNLEGRLDSASLASAITAQVWKDRYLGASRMVEIPQRATWIGNGNNIRLGGDLQRRCYWTRLDAKMAKPWLTRKFTHPDLLAWVTEHRGRLLAALLTLAGAWYRAGQPKANTPVLGGFEAWSQTVGGILAYAGLDGFLGNLDAMYEVADEETAEWERFLLALNQHFKGSPFSVAALVGDLEQKELADNLPEELERDRATLHGSFSKKLGKAFSKRLDRRYGASEAHLQHAGESRDGKLWMVVTASPPLTLAA